MHASQTHREKANSWCTPRAPHLCTERHSLACTSSPIELKILVSVYFPCSLHMHIYGVNFFFVLFILFIFNKISCLLFIEAEKYGKNANIANAIFDALVNIFVCIYVCYIHLTLDCVCVPALWLLHHQHNYYYYYYYYYLHFHCICGQNQVFMFHEWPRPSRKINYIGCAFVSFADFIGHAYFH